MCFGGCTASPISGSRVCCRFLSRTNVELADADKAAVIAAITSIQGSSRRVPDTLIVMAAQQARVDFIATFDEKLASPLVQVRML